MSKPREHIEQLQRSLGVPGDKLCVIEEFMPGEGAYVDDNGFVRVGVVGRIFFDWSTRRVSVLNPLSKPMMPRRGSIVHGLALVAIREDLLLIKVFADERLRRFSGTYTAFLHVSQAADRIVKSIFELVKPGDVVKARVVNATHPYQLNIKHGALGVVAAFCSRCGAPLYKVPGQELLVCLKCGNKEPRKTATGYIFVYKGRHAIS